ncbi:mycofactocin system FadH/OYE family oxidoreductase 1 [Rhodococcus sp. NPDC049939]|uniref:mycofactocin system FadH/OYE family oxidoreductase 1 n=1 Tax=Rhodococcus sp. NPDC049939 TaxID=3155511 RepID=UPI00340D924B
MSVELTDPITLVGRRAQSRVLLGPHPTNLCVGRRLSQRHVAYYERRARGGTGIVVTEVASVHGSDWPYERAPLASECIGGWRDVVAACRPHGTLVLAGLGHTGLQGSSAFSQSVMWGPSQVADVISRELPMQMERSEIATLMEAFRSGAAAAVSADVDGVELDAGPRGLLRQFLSGLTNLRDDEYGTDPLRLIREVIVAVRQELGSDRVLSLRLSCDEMAPWAGITPDDAAAFVKELVDFLDLLVVVGGGPMSTNAYRPDFHRPTSFNTALCRDIRTVVAGAASVVLQGSVVEASAAQWALDDGVADLVEMTRAQIADPDLVVKIRSGQNPRPCVLCNQTCQVLDPRNPIVTCISHPTAGFETIDPDEEESSNIDPGAVLVVGAGPSGLEAARVLAVRGHRVIVAESADRTGGMVRIAAPHLESLTDWLHSECRRLGVEFRLGSTISEADLDAAERSGATVILATGSRPRPLPFPIEGRTQCVDAAEVWGGVLLREGPVVVFDPVGGPVGVAVAERLAACGREVSIVTQDSVAGSRLGMTGDLVDANSRLQRAGVVRRLDSRIMSIDETGIRIRNRYTGAETVASCGVLVDCSHRLPEDTLAALRPGAVRVGDCVAPRTVLEAIREGRSAALNVTTGRPSDFDKNPLTLVNER